MKILHIIPSLSKGGAERLVLDMCRALSKKSDITVKLITFRNVNAYPFLTDGLDWKVVQSTVVPSLSGKTLVEISALQEVIEAFQPDIIHSHLFETEIVLSQINYPKAKYVVHFHNNMVQFENWKWRNVFSKVKLTNFYEKRIVEAGYRKRKTEFIAISKSSMDYIQEVLPPTFEKMLLHNAVDLTRFHKVSARRDIFQLVIIGSLNKNKGHQLAVEAIFELTKRSRIVYLHILGEGPERKYLENYVQDLNLTSAITFHGSVDRPEQFLEECHLYLHTSYKEAFGLTIIEAMACGLPVVCTDGGGNRDLIKDGINGFMVNKRDPKQLADKIELLLTDSTFRKQMGENAHSFAQQFSMESYVDRLLELYQT